MKNTYKIYDDLPLKSQCGPPALRLGSCIDRLTILNLLHEKHITNYLHRPSVNPFYLFKNLYIMFNKQYFPRETLPVFTDRQGSVIKTIQLIFNTNVYSL